MECVAPTPKLDLGEVKFANVINRNDQIEFYTLQFNNNTSNVQANCYTYIDGNYQKSSVQWIKNAVQKLNIYPVEFFYGQDGDDYILGYRNNSKSDIDNIEDRDISYVLIKKSSDSDGFIDITPSFWSDDTGLFSGVTGYTVTNLQVAQNKTLCYQFDYKSDLYFYDQVKEKEVSYGNFATNQGYLIKENSLYFITEDFQEIQTYQLDGNNQEKIDITSVSGKAYLQVSSHNSILLLDCDGIHEYKDGGTTWKTVVNGKQGTMSSPSYEITSFLVVPGTTDDYYVLYSSQITGKEDLFTVYSCNKNTYEVSNATSTIIQKELTIYSMWDNISIRQAMSEYMKLYPEVSINYVVAMTDESSATQADLIRTLNTEILAGNGADILLMDGLPLESYVQKGILMDLSDILCEPNKNNILMNNITDNYMNDGRIYCMPMRIYMPIYAMSKDITIHTKTVEDLATYSQSSNHNLIEELSYNLLVQEFVYTYWNQILNEDGLFDQERLTSFLQSMYDIANQTGAQMTGDYGVSIGESGTSGANERMRKILCGGAHLILLEDIDTSVTFFGDIMDMTTSINCIKEKEGIYTTINETFVPDGLVAINKATKESELAKDFVTYLFSEEVQSVHLNDGFPVNEKALYSWMEVPEDEDIIYGFHTSNEHGKIVDLQFGSLTVEEKQAVEAMLKTLTRPVYNDYVSMDMILEGAVEYLSDKKSLDQVVSEIIDRVNRYLTE